MRSTEPVNRVMSTPILTIDLHDTVQDLLDIVAAYPVHHVPVVENSCAVGLVSSADILKFKHFFPVTHDRRAAALGWPVSKIMHAPVITIEEHESVQRAAEIMVTNAIHCLPVVNREAHVIGIVTTTDIMNELLRGHATDKVAATTNTPGDAEQTRLQKLERVLFAAKRYLNAGQDEQLHKALRLAVDGVERDETMGL